MIRHRSGEEVSEPIMEFEDGGDMAAAPVVARVDINRVLPDRFFERRTDRATHQSVLAPDGHAIASASAALGQQGWDEAEDNDEDHPSGARKPHERLGTQDEDGLLRLALEHPQRFLQRLHAESARRGPLTIRFLRPLATGRAVLDISAQSGQLLISGRLEIPRRGPLSLRTQRVAGLSGFDLEVEARLRPNGDLDEISTHWRIRGLDLDPRERRMMDRLALVVTRIADGPGSAAARRTRLARVLGTWLRRHPIWSVALLDRLAGGLTALPVSASVRQKRAERRRDRGGPTLDEILEGITEPGTAELMLSAPPPANLRWADDGTAQIVSADPARDTQARVELLRLQSVLPAILMDLPV